MGDISLVKTGIGFFDDGSELKGIKKSFKSEVYASFDDYMTDIGLLARNENFRGELPFVTKSSKPRRSPEERTAILVQKIEAQRRFDQHAETGGTEICIGKLPNMLDVKKASH
ncbi:hypothetical protein SO574_23375 (plasmid) [Vibrio alfacsensis]|uniref:hypothetical protein n=1 Tax=Vibrio alfacsensis TaxID=1074311 RepID=UPI002ADD427F|nr:hypothetical protein [Vibrio alfacsensis]WQE79482.1 hypothetical protein SO574_23375 [Vibrio alfacsensis]